MKLDTLSQSIIRNARLLALSAVTAGSAMAGTVSVPAGKSGVVPQMPTEDWLNHTISPVTNPIYFEDAAIRTEIRPIYMHHTIDNNFITKGGTVDVWALQLRYAITDRLAFIATKDGYISLDPGAGSSQSGWADLTAGFKYAVIDDRANALLVTPGFTFEIPLGNRDVFQGNGDGQFDLFVSAQKGFGDFHISANTGFLVPLDQDAESTSFHYSIMADYYVHQYFIPFVSLNGFTVVDSGNTVPINTEGFDLINFGSSQANGANQMAFGVGFRSRLTKHVDFGFAWETALGSPTGLYDNRLTFDVSLRF
jgi:Putative MetA-pathway of phenol degradation